MTTTNTWLLNWIRAASNFIGLFFKCCNTFWELKSKGLYWSSGKGKENCLAFTSFTKREIRHFHFVVVQLRQRNVEKSVINVQSCCFETYCFFAFLVAFAVVKAQVSYSPSLRAVKMEVLGLRRELGWPGFTCSHRCFFVIPSCNFTKFWFASFNPNSA